MKKTYKIKGIDCPNCAAKLERKISKLEGVNKASVSFTTQRMSIEADEDRIDALMEEAVKVMKEMEPDWEVVK